MSGNSLPTEIVEAVDGALEAAGLAHYDAAIVIVRVPTPGGGCRIMSANMGNADVLRALLEEEKQRLAPGIITLGGGKPN